MISLVARVSADKMAAIESLVLKAVEIARDDMHIEIDLIERNINVLL